MSKEAAPVEFTNTGATKVSIAKVDFLPGQTKPIQEQYLARVREAPIVKAGTLREGKVSMTEPPKREGPSDLEALEDIHALAQVRLCTDLSKLKSWSDAEASGKKRPAILAAIRDKAEALAKG